MKKDQAIQINRRSFLRTGGIALSGGAAWLGAGQARAADTVTAEDRAEKMTIPVWYYQQHDADYKLAVPEQGFGGWKKTELEFSRKHTAVVIMHAWDLGSPEQFPGWWRGVPYAPRAEKIDREIFPPLLKAVRESGLPLFHGVGGGDYYKNLPGYRRAVALAGAEPEPLEKVVVDPLRSRLDRFRADHIFPGRHNQEDFKKGFARLDFSPQARPVDAEGIAENARQLLALCREHRINHLVYLGFAINWCMLLSPGGMADMSRHGLMCSVLRQATTAVENKESAPQELAKELALWRVSVGFGFVFDVDDFIGGIKRPA